MGEMDLETLLKVASDEKVANNALTLTDALKEVDKIINQGDKIINFINRLEKSPLLGTAFRAQMKKSGVSVEPLVSDGGIIPNSPEKRQLLENINALNENQLKEFMQMLLDWNERKKKVTDNEIPK